MIGIYCFTNVVNNKKYIGQSISIETRKKSHFYCSLNKRYNGYDTKFYRAIRKYGFDSFLFEVLVECEQKKLNELESFYIDKFDSFKNGYNSSIGGDVVANGFGEHHSQSILTEKDVLEIKNILKDISLTQYEIASKYNITQSEISNINSGIRWGFLGEFTYPIRKDGVMRRGEMNHSSILSDEEVIYIRKEYEKKTAKIIFEEFKDRMSYTSFERALMGRTYSHLPVYKKRLKQWIEPVSTIPS